MIQQTKTKYQAVEQLNAIIREIITLQEYPSWKFLNNVLSCEEILGDNELWLHWDKLLVVTPKDREMEKRVGQMKELYVWNTEADGTITLIGKKWSD